MQPRPAPVNVPAEPVSSLSRPAWLFRPEPDVSTLLQIVQRPSLEIPIAPPRAVDPAVRERILAQLRGLQQIPALQSLAKNFGSS